MNRDLLEHTLRQRVYEAVAREPGATLPGIAERLGVPPATARYHLDLLVRKGLVVGLGQGHRTFFFRNRGDFSPEERALVALLRSPGALRVLERIAAAPWVTRTELCVALEVSRSSVNWHLRTLMGLGLVAEAREQQRGFLYVRAGPREALRRVAARLEAAPAGGLEAAAPGQVAASARPRPSS